MGSIEWYIHLWVRLKHPKQKPQGFLLSHHSVIVKGCQRPQLCPKAQIDNQEKVS